MVKLVIQPDTDATRDMVRRHAEAYMRGGADHKVVIAEMRKSKATKAQRRARRGAR